jgi:hypothetical protein
MYKSIIATDFFTIQGSHAFERMNDTQLADLGIERQGRSYLRDGKLVYEVSRFDAREFVSRIVAILASSRRRRAAAA